MGTNLARLLENYWKQQRIVPKAGKCLGTVFDTGRGVTQIYPTSSIIFNILVDAVVLAVMEVVCSMHGSQNGLGCAAGDINLVFCADYRWISGWDHEWIQDKLTMTVYMFHRMGLESNLEKTKVMVCTPRFIWGK